PAQGHGPLDRALGVHHGFSVRVGETDSDFKIGLPILVRLDANHLKADEVLVEREDVVGRPRRAEQPVGGLDVLDFELRDGGNRGEEEEAKGEAHGSSPGQILIKIRFKYIHNSTSQNTTITSAPRTIDSYSGPKT